MSKGWAEPSALVQCIGCLASHPFSAVRELGPTEALWAHICKLSAAGAILLVCHSCAGKHIQARRISGLEPYLLSIIWPVEFLHIPKPRNFNLTVYIFKDKSSWLHAVAAQQRTINLGKLLETETPEGSRNDANRRSCSDSVTYQLVLHFYCRSEVIRVCKF